MVIQDSVDTCHVGCYMNDEACPAKATLQAISDKGNFDGCGSIHKDRQLVYWRSILVTVKQVRRTLVDGHRSDN